MSRRFFLVAPLFLLSGATALLYQVAFGKKLATIYGATAYAVSAVLAAFMGGLALGSHLGGRWSTRIRRPLVVYGVAEALVGLVCAVTPALFDGIAVAYRSLAVSLPNSLAALTVLRAGLTGAVVLVPTIAMGLTLPMLARDLGRASEQESGRRQLALLYGINTFGGALGAMTSAYLVLPLLGLTGTMQAAAVVNLAIGVVAIVVGLREEAPEAESSLEGSSAKRDAEKASAAATSAPREPLALLAFLSGLLVFATEVVDTHLLALLIGNSAYAFGLMLAVFLTCLSLGAALAGRLDRRFRAAALPYALVLTGVALLASLPILGALPRLFIRAGGHVDSWLGRELVRAAAAFMALALPTTCMGLTFPLLLRRVAGLPDVGRRVGRLTAINTIGSIIGAIGCGYLMLPALGSELCIIVIAVAFALGGLLPAWGRREQLQRALAGVGLTVAIALLLPRWDMKLMTNGANVYFHADRPPDELVFVAEDVHGGLTTVARRDDVLTLYTNGKFQGDNGAEVTAQRSFAHFPAMFVRDFERALVVGLGTGTTLGTIAAYPFRSIEVAEISPAIIAAARRFFADLNGNSLEEERVELILNDGRNHLLTSTQQYDLITIELTSVWFAGAANLYSSEFYGLARDRLRDSGVLQQWLQLHHIHPRELAVALRTLKGVFPHVALFVSGAQGIVIASESPLVVSRAHIAELDAIPAIRESLGGLPSLLDLTDRLMLSGPELDRFIADHSGGAPPASTDDNLYLEYATPKGNVLGYETSIRAMLRLLESYRTPAPRDRHVRN